MINATKANYIKLGEKGSYEQYCLSKNVITLGFYEVPHSENFDRKIVKEVFAKLGRNTSTCTSYANQVGSFYDANENTLWFTFSNGKLWWCISKPGVKYNGNDKEKYPNGSRYLETIDGWHDSDINGNQLFMHELNGDLTKIVGFQGTICSLSSEKLEYLLRKINGYELDLIIQARKNKEAIIHSISEMMKLLNPKDFELLVELVFAQSGWQRISTSGGTQKTVDLELYLPSTSEYAFVQVKTATTQKELEEYEQAAELRDIKYMFYVYHTAKKKLQSSSERTKIIGPEKFAEMILNAGLFDWLLKKAR